MPTFSGYLVGISKSGYTASFDGANLATDLGILPVSGVDGSTLSGFLVGLANTEFVCSGWESALDSQNLVPGKNIPAEASNEAGLIVVAALLTRAASAIRGPGATSLPQAILARLNGLAVEKGFSG